VSRAAVLAVLLMAGWGVGRAAAQADVHGGRAVLDVHAFSQSDRGGNPYREEAFGYGGVGVSLRVRAGENVVLRADAVGGFIANDDPIELPRTIRQARTTSASEDIQTLDAVAGIDVTPRGGRWTLRPGLFYHHQRGYITPGADLGSELRLFDGNTTLSAAYGLRVAMPNNKGWGGKKRRLDVLVTQNLQLAWTQILSPRWLALTSVQYTRQDGRTDNSFNYVVLFDAGGEPTTMIDELLPRIRNRLQVNGRLRFSPRVGLALGLDGSLYLDDWSIRHGALQPSVELPLGRGIRWRLWYRIARQRGTRYTVPLGSGWDDLDGAYRTQDADLATFTMHGPGMRFWIPAVGTRAPTWATRIALLGFLRSDGIFGLGGNLGVEADW